MKVGAEDGVRLEGRRGERREGSEGTRCELGGKGRRMVIGRRGGEVQGGREGEDERFVPALFDLK